MAKAEERINQSQIDFERIQNYITGESKKPLWPYLKVVLQMCLVPLRRKREGIQRVINKCTVHWSLVESKSSHLQLCLVKDY